MLSSPWVSASFGRKDRDRSSHQAMRDDQADLRLGPRTARAARLPARPPGRRAGTAKSASRRRRLTPDSSSGRPKTFSVRIVELEITPEPSPEERAAIAARSSRAGGESAGPYRSVWRLAGLLENVESAGDAPPVRLRHRLAAQQPRRQPGVVEPGDPRQRERDRRAPRRRSSRRMRRPRRALRARPRRPASRS